MPRVVSFGRYEEEEHRGLETEGGNGEQRLTKVKGEQSCCIASQARAQYSLRSALMSSRN